ncbi:hypothetical protein PAHA111176_02800 [Parendozoicomonas haliclonae]|uniref:Uncharacterized protein n=1 Tax=Parendozoicomonas haliclonae TaxID=1960125 RepID=A0A1X7AJ94_9GAMM|nr:hypothetical protein EHSB41UT_01924 [Parendozoicomonas haliclonae]
MNATWYGAGGGPFLFVSAPGISLYISVDDSGLTCHSPGVTCSRSENPDSDKK